MKVIGIATEIPRKRDLKARRLKNIKPLMDTDRRKFRQKSTLFIGKRRVSVKSARDRHPPSIPPIKGEMDGGKFQFCIMPLELRQEVMTISIKYYR